MKTVKMNNGIEIPIPEYGVYQAEPTQTENGVNNRCAASRFLLYGYRMSDMEILKALWINCRRK